VAHGTGARDREEAQRIIASKIPLASFNRSLKAVAGIQDRRKDQWNCRFPGVWR
jgi:hypothetical protein